MKLFLIAFLSFYQVTSTEWLVDFENAKWRAQKEHKHILLNFSGSDWCGPCIQMHKQIFETTIFEEFAKEELILLRADFPRAKRNALSAIQQKKNEQLAESYNKKGAFPLTLLLNSEGKVIQSWDGFTVTSPEQFTKQIQTSLYGER
jgi:thioredoxin-related protein